MPSDMPLPEASWSRVVGIIAASACVPLGVIEDALFGDSPGMSCKAYVEHRLAKLPKPAAKDENERARRCWMHSSMMPESLAGWRFGST